MEVIERILGIKFKLIMVIVLPLILVAVVVVGLGAYNFVQRLRFPERAVPAFSVEVQEDVIREVFRVASLEIESSNTSVLTTRPGRINPGTVSFVLEYDSLVTFWVRDANEINMRRIGNVVFVEEASIHIETQASVRNFRRVDTFRSNPLVRITQSVIDDIFAVQSEYEETAAQRLTTDHYVESARRNFMSTFEAVCSGLGLTVIWE